MIKIGDLTAKFLRAEKYSNYIVPYKLDLPIRTCAKYGVNLKVTYRKNLGIKIVTVCQEKIMIGEMMSIYPLLNMLTLYVNVLKENFLG